MWGDAASTTAQRDATGSDAVGTRFLLYPQAPHVPGYGTPEPVWISTPPDGMRPGPADARMYVADPGHDKEPYAFPFLPPFVGDLYPPAEAGPDGHFDHLVPGTRAFIAAHAFASAHRVLDIWESYLGETIDWHFAPSYDALEIIPCIDWDNAQSGFGFLELGMDQADDGQTYPFALNMDVIAHEVGHAILFSLYGFPENGLGDGDYGALHESGADLVSLLSFLHFDTGIDRLLRRTKGNLLVLNELNRIAELAGERQIRLAGNARKLSEVTSEIHDLSRPFTGAVFDTMIACYHESLVQDGYADERLLDIDIREVDDAAMHRLSQITSAGYADRPFLYKSALTAARDRVGLALAQAWSGFDPNGLSFRSAALATLDAADRSDPPLAAHLEENFNWREIL
ncbi:MAG: hypothetical protein ACOC71_04410 [Hyphomicrobiales bacterium]